MRQHIPSGKGAKAVESTMVRGANKARPREMTTADEILERAMECNGNRLGAVSPQLATLTLISKAQPSPKPVTPSANNLAATPYVVSGASSALSGVTTPAVAVPTNIETGSLVVLTVNDPLSPSKKMLQTYIAHGGGSLTPVALPTTFLNSVVGYMKKGTPKATHSSPHFASPSSVTSQDGRTSITPSVIQVNPHPAKRQRHASFTITQL